MARYIFVCFLFSFLLDACGPIGDCGYRYKYSGKVNIPDSMDYQKIVIGIEKLDRAVFEFDTTAFKDGLNYVSVDKHGFFNVEGSFLGECPSREIKKFKKDRLRYEIKYQNSLLQRGTLEINKLVKNFTDSLNLLTFEMPVFHLAQNKG